MPGVFLLDVLDRTSTFDTPNGKTSCVAEAAYHSRLPLQRTLHRFVEFRRLVQIHHIDVPIRRRDHQQLVLHIHAVDPVLAFDTGYRRWLPEIPVLDRLVPRARYEYRTGAARHIDETDTSDGLVVCGDLDCGRGAAKVEHAGCFVGTAADDFAAILQWSINRL